MKHKVGIKIAFDIINPSPRVDKIHQLVFMEKIYAFVRNWCTRPLNAAQRAMTSSRGQTERLMFLAVVIIDGLIYANLLTTEHLMDGYRANYMYIVRAVASKLKGGGHFCHKVDHDYRICVRDACCNYTIHVFQCDKSTTKAKF